MDLRLFDVTVVTAGRKPLACLICGHDDGFVKREELMNTAGMTWMGWDWANKKAWAAICPRCGYVHTFMGVGLEWTERGDTTADLE
jgi:hypothetical protein